MFKVFLCQIKSVVVLMSLVSLLIYCFVFCLVFKIIYYFPPTYFISSNYISFLSKIKREKTKSEFSDPGVSWLISG